MTTAPLSNDARAIEELRSKLGGRLTIVGHHYEQEATIQHCDIRGDSLELARRVPGIEVLGNQQHDGAFRRGAGNVGTTQGIAIHLNPVVRRLG